MQVTVSELIAALEKAEGPDPILDAAIMQSLRPEVTFRAEHNAWFYQIGDVPVRVRVEPYTSSIDAVLPLVPAGAWWEISAPYGEKHLARSSMYIEGKCAGYSRHKIPAIALCIAALKARDL